MFLLPAVYFLENLLREFGTITIPVTVSLSYLTCFLDNVMRLGGDMVPF